MQNSSQHLAQAAQVLQLIHFCAEPKRTNQRQHYLHFIHSGSLAAGRLRWRVGRRIDSRAANSRGPPNQWDTLQVISGNEKSIGVIATRRQQNNFRRARRDRRPGGPAHYRKSTTTCHINICAINVRVQLKTFSPAMAERKQNPGGQGEGRGRGRWWRQGH